MATLRESTSYEDIDSNGSTRSFRQFFTGTEVAVAAARNAIDKGDESLPTEHFPAALAGDEIYGITVSRQLGKSAMQGGACSITIESGPVGGGANFRQVRNPPKTYPHHTAGSMDGTRPIISMINSGYAPPLVQWLAEPNPLLKKNFKFRSPGGIESLDDYGAESPTLVELATWILSNGNSLPASDHSVETEFEDNDASSAKAHCTGLMKVDNKLNNPFKLDGWEYLKRDARIVEAWVSDTDGTQRKVYHTTVRWAGRPSWQPTWLYKSDDDDGGAGDGETTTEG